MDFFLLNLNTCTLYWRQKLTGNQIPYLHHLETFAALSQQTHSLTPVSLHLHKRNAENQHQQMMRKLTQENKMPNKLQEI